MRRRVILAVVLVLAFTATGAGIVIGSGTWARFSDSEKAGNATVGAATVVLGGRSTPLTLDFAAMRSGTTRTVNLTVDYRGTVPATVQFQLPSGATSTSCVRSGTTWTDGALVGALTIALGNQPAVPYCPLLDGTARTLVTTVNPGTTTVVPVTVGFTGQLLGLISRSERAAIAVRAVGGFTDRVTGTVSITTTGAIGPRSLAVAAPAAARTATVAAPPPAECTGSYAETVVLTADRPRFVAAEDRPGAPGPFLVQGTSGDDVVTGSAAGDCLVGGGGSDVLDGAGGADVLLGGDGVDTLTGGTGDDRLLGGAGVDRIVGGAGADVLDGQVDGGTCDADQADTVTSCTVPVSTPEGAPDAPLPVPPAEPVPVPAPAPAEPAPAPAPAEPAPAAPAEPVPADPAPVPVDPAPVEPAPVEPAPEQGAPVPEGAADPSAGPGG